VHCYRQEASAAVADKLVKALAKALQDLCRKPSVGSPSLGKLMGIAELTRPYFTLLHRRSTKTLEATRLRIAAGTGDGVVDDPPVNPGSGPGR
jgi:hypothetical protein